MEREKLRSFLLAFVLTMGALATIMVVTVMAVQPSLRQNRPESAPEPDSHTYRPRADDSLTLVVIGVGGAKDGGTGSATSAAESSAAGSGAAGSGAAGSGAAGSGAAGSGVAENGAAKSGAEPAGDSSAPVGGRAKPTATDFLLIRFNPQYGQVPLTLLPPQSAVKLDGVSVTLEQAYLEGGGVSVKAALSERLGIAVDRYAIISRDLFIRLAEKTGSVTFSLPYRIEYNRSGYKVSLPPGERRLDGRDIADLFEYPGFPPDGLDKSALLGELTAAIVNQNLEAASESRSSGLFRFAVNLLDTDITSADYEVRRRAADFMSTLDVSMAGNLPVAGVTLGGSGNLELSEDYIELVRQYFQPLK